MSHKTFPVKPLRVLFTLALLVTTLFSGGMPNSVHADKTLKQSKNSKLSNHTATQSAVQKSSNQISKENALEIFGKQPISFEENQGQTDKQVKFSARGNGFTTYLTETESVLVLSKNGNGKDKSGTASETLRMKPVGANSKPSVGGQDKLPGVINHYLGNDPAKWRTNVATYGKVRYENVYPGIDAVWYGNQRQLEYDFIVSPGASPKTIALKFEGAKSLSIEKTGDLTLQMKNGVIGQQKPHVYQEIDGIRHAVAGKYIRKGNNTVGFEIGNYDARYPLVIDPVLGYSTYLGGSNIEELHAVAMDQSGNVYVAGWTISEDFPTQNSYHPYRGSDAFVSKINTFGSGDSSLAFSTFLGGNGEDRAFDLFVGNSIHVVGVTSSTSAMPFPLVDEYQGSLNGFGDAFVAKLNLSGVVTFSTYLGGSGIDSGYLVAGDNDGNTYVAGIPTAGFPTVNAYQSTSQGEGDVFLARFDNNNQLAYSTYLGGSGSDRVDNINGVLLAGADQRAYLVGTTSEPLNPPQTPFLFPVTSGAFQTSPNGGPNNPDIFVSKINTGASGLASLEYSTYLGGNSNNFPRDAAIDSSGNIFVTGYTSSTNFPTLNAFQPGYGGGTYDAFLTKINTLGSGSASLAYSTYLGGNNDDRAHALAVDGSGNVFLTGATKSGGTGPFPTTLGAFQTTTNGGDAFVTKVNPFNGGSSSLVYSTYLGGINSCEPSVFCEEGLAITVDLAGNAYVLGNTNSAQFPLQNPVQQNPGGNTDVFVTVLNSSGTGLVFSTYLGGGNADKNDWATAAIAVTNAGDILVAGTTFSDNFPVTPSARQPIASNQPGSFLPNIFVTRLSPPEPPVIVTNPTNQTSCVGGSATFTVSATGVPAPTFQWQFDDLPVNGVFVNLSNGGGIAGATAHTLTVNPVTASHAGQYRCIATNMAGSATSAAATLTVFDPPTAANAGPDQTICSNNTATLSANSPVVGSGAWSIVSGGTGTFTPNASTPNAVFTPTNGAPSYTLRWTITSGTCPASTDDVVITNQTVLVNPASLPGGTIGTGYSQTIVASGGTAPYTFTLASGTLPAGLTLAAGGVLSGTPTATGSNSFTVAATDAGGCTGTQAYTVNIGCQTITVTNPATASGTAGTAFSQTFTQTGGIGSTTFALASGTLPAGLTLSSAGVLAGTPTQAGAFPVTVRATDANGCQSTGETTYPLNINCQTITVTNPVVNTGTAGTAFSQAFTQTGGIGTTTFSTASTLPSGLTLSSAGVLSGTPTQSGTFPITVRATDVNGCQGAGNVYQLSLDCQTITVSPTTISAGTAGSAFSQTFTQTGGIGTTAITLSGTLPTGLSFVSPTLLGTPTQTGSFPITVTATDSNGCTGSRNYTLVINCQAFSVNPASISAGTAGTPYSATFSQVGGIGTTSFALSGTLPAGLSFVSPTLSGTPTQTGNFPFTVTATDSNGCTGARNYTLTITCQTITVTNPTTATGFVGTVFSQTFTQTGGIGTTTFSTASTLPSGLTLSSAGVLSGTPTQLGTFPIVATATDSNGCQGSGATYTLVISGVELPTLFVADTAHHKIQKYNGTAWSYVGASQTFNLPKAVVASPDGTRIYVADTGNQRVQYSTDSGSTWATFSTTSGTNYPQGLALDLQGNLYVSISGPNSRVNRYNGGTPGSGVTLANDGSGAGQVDRPRGLAIDNSFNLFIADLNNNRILKVANANTVTTANTGTTAVSSSTVSLPEAVGVDNAGNLYIADTGNQRIRRLTPGGSLSVLCTPGTALGQVSYPAGVTVSFFTSGSLAGESALIVGDTGNNRIEGRLLSGSPWVLLGGPGAGVGNFSAPTNIR